jgi:hypothetical protein
MAPAAAARSALASADPSSTTRQITGRPWTVPGSRATTSAIESSSLCAGRKATTGASAGPGGGAGRGGGTRGSRSRPQYDGPGTISATSPAASAYPVLTACAARAIANARPGGTPIPARAAVAAASYVPMPPGVTATACAAMVTAVIATASNGVSATSAARATCQNTADSNAHAAAAATATARPVPGPGSRTPPGSRPRPSRRSHITPPAAPSASAAPAAHTQGPASSSSSPGTATSASTSTASRSAARIVTADAVTGRTVSSVRRSTLVTRRISPSRNGSTWLPSSATCSAAHDWPGDRPGSTAVQARARSAKAAA